MLINIKEIKDYLENGSIYKLAKDTQLNESLLYRYRRGELKLENMSLSIASQIQDYLNGGHKVKKLFELLENEIEYDKLGFEYEEGMNFTNDVDSDPIHLGFFENLEDAKNELKNYQSEKRVVGNKVLVKEVYIVDGLYDEEEEFVQGSDLWAVAPLK